MEWEKENIKWNGAQLYIKRGMLTINKKYFPVISDFRQIKWKAVLR